MNRRPSWRPFALAALLAGVLSVLAATYRPQTGVIDLRDRGWRHRIECKLEEWGIIPHDFGRHNVG